MSSRNNRLNHVILAHRKRREKVKLKARPAPLPVPEQTDLHLGMPTDGLAERPAVMLDDGFWTVTGKGRKYGRYATYGVANWRKNQIVNSGKMARKKAA